MGVCAQTGGPAAVGRKRPDHIPKGGGGAIGCRRRAAAGLGTRSRVGCHAYESTLLRRAIVLGGHPVPSPLDLPFCA